MFEYAIYVLEQELRYAEGWHTDGVFDNSVRIVDLQQAISLLEKAGKE
jgi:hypothetical protein